MKEAKTVRKVDVFSNKERIFRLGTRRRTRKMTTFLKCSVLLYANEFSEIYDTSEDKTIASTGRVYKKTFGSL